MKKIIPLFLALVLVLAPLSGLAEEADTQIYTDTIPFQNSTTVFGQRFTLEVGQASGTGWRVGGPDNSQLVIKPQADYQNTLEIVDVQLTVSSGYNNYVRTVASSGTKDPAGDTVKVKGVNSDSLTLSMPIAGGTVFFKDVVVSYRCKNHVFTGGVCPNCGNECQHDFSEGHICKICGSECQHDFDAEHKCQVCGMTECQLTGRHDFADGKCQLCGYTCSCLDGHCPECGREVPSVPPTASTLSQGSMTVVLCVASAALASVGTLVITKKKKKN